MILNINLIILATSFKKSQMIKINKIKMKIILVANNKKVDPKPHKIHLNRVLLSKR